MKANKKYVEQLAIFGGPPAFKEKLHVGRPNIGNQKRLFQRIKKALKDKWLTNNGPYVQEFERKICSLLGTKHCVATSNGTVALEIAIRALELKGEVIIPAFTFVATAHALQWQGITPVFCDIDPQTYNIDPQKIPDLITPHTTGIIGVHIWGRPCEIDLLTDIAKQFNLKLLFDSAHAFACSYRGKVLGGFGDAEVLSFHATKILNTFEGGAVVTNQDDLAKKIRLLRNFGFIDYDQVISLGINGKMNEISAAMGLTGLEDLKRFRSINFHNYQLYRSALNAVPGVKVMTYNENETNNFHYVILEILEDAVLNRDELLKILHAENVFARRYFFPGVHRMEPYQSLFPFASSRLPETGKVCRRVLALPTGTAMGMEQIKTVCHLIALAVENHAEVRNRLRQTASIASSV